MKAESLRMFHFRARHFAARGLPGWRLAKPSQRDNPAHKGAFGRRKRGIDDYLDLRRGTPVDPLALRQVVARAILVYVVGLFIVRLGKGRLVGRASGLDILVGFILGSLLSRGITGHASLSGTIVSSAVIVATHWLFTWLGVRFHVFGNITKGHSVQLISDGLVLPANMKRSHISEHDLLEAARLHGVENRSKVAQAFKERSGDISVVKRE